jgi:hypothetical protein
MHAHINVCIYYAGPWLERGERSKAQKKKYGAPHYTSKTI